MNDLMPVNKLQAAFIVFATAFALLLGLASDARAQAGDAVRVSVYVIEASDGVPGVDSEIRHIVKQFHGTFRYSTYKLISKVPKTIPAGGSTKIVMPGLRTLDISSLGYEGGRAKLKVKIVQKKPDGRRRDVLNTSFAIAKGGTMLIGGYDYHKGKLILAISADK